MAEVPQNTRVCLSSPSVGIPEVKPGHRGRRLTRPRVLSSTKPVEVRQPDTILHRVRVRTIERGVLEGEFAVRQVWTVYEDKPVEEWLVIRKEANGRTTYALSNAPADASLEQLAFIVSANATLVSRRIKRQNRKSVRMNWRHRSIELGNTTWR